MSKRPRRNHAPVQFCQTSSDLYLAYDRAKEGIFKCFFNPYLFYIVIDKKRVFSLKFIHVDTYLYNYPDLYLIDVVQLSLISVIDFTYKSINP